MAMHKLDVRGAKCPMPIVKAKKQLDLLVAGDVLEVTATDPGSVKDFQGWAKINQSAELKEQRTEKDETGREVGMLELDFREPHDCELSFVGLIPELSGQGHGPWLLAEALRRAWRENVDRVHVHTCSLDHPAALTAYRRAGFTAYKRAIERFPDPRLLGILPKDCALQIPLLGTLA